MWVLNLGIDAVGATHVCQYRTDKVEWYWPMEDRGIAETHREATSRIANMQSGIIIHPQAWQHIGEEDMNGIIATGYTTKRLCGRGSKTNYQSRGMSTSRGQHSNEMGGTAKVLPSIASRTGDKGDKCSRNTL